MTEWRLIETAPRDTPYLAAKFAPTSWTYVVVHVDPRRFSNDRHKEINLRYCTHWMPLPAAPMEKEDD